MPQAIKVIDMKGATPTLPGVGFFFKFMSTLALIPFGWNQKEGIMRPRSRAVFYYWIFFGVIVPGMHLISSMTLFGKLVLFISKNDGWDNVNHLLKFTFALLVVLANTSFACYAVVVMRNHHEMMKFYNEIIRLRIHLREVGAPLKNNVAPFKALAIVLILRVYVTVTLSISHPEKPLFLYWAIPQSLKSPTFHMAYVVFNVIYCLTFWTTLFFISTTMCIYVETVRAGLEYRNSLKNTRVMGEVRVYRELLLLSRLFDNAFGTEGLPMFLSFVTTILTFATYAVVRFYGRVIPKLYFSFLSPFFGISALISCLVLPAAILKEQSGELRRKILKEIPLKKKVYGRAVLRSFPDLNLHASNYFVVERKTFVTILGFVLYNALTLLITL